MWVLAGLGNPGSAYARHRHNVGFMAVDAISHRHSFARDKKSDGAFIAEGSIDGQKCMIIKPQGYMNTSGVPVANLARFYRVAPQNVIVFHDELDLTPGKIRVKRGGGAAGHNGLRSLDAHLGNDTWRVRIGIGHPGAKEMVHHHVLSNFNSDDAEWLSPTLLAIADSIGFLLQGQPDKFMNRVAETQQKTFLPTGKNHGL